jgi:soluble lytic murein transglycosylase-like protein
MNAALIIAALAAGAAGVFFARKGEAAEMYSNKGNAAYGETPSLDSLYAKYGARYGVDPALIKAHAIVESNERPDAVRNNPPHDVSVGVMQVLCLPGANGVCSNRFNIEGWSGMTFDRLKDAETNIMLAAQIIAWNLRTYGFKRGIAVYNSYAARHAGENGPFPNERYVAKVLFHFNKLKGKAQ